mmetsp:Transcript_107740/g.347826  ORF Transcript_107740/g.347826 Transcript_107740/m.347826 type:complete len:222 (+) Transcript_107740:312-977(+)
MFCDASAAARKASLARVSATSFCWKSCGRTRALIDQPLAPLVTSTPTTHRQLSSTARAAATIASNCGAKVGEPSNPKGLPGVHAFAEEFNWCWAGGRRGGALAAAKSRLPSKVAGWHTIAPATAPGAAASPQWPRTSAPGGASASTDCSSSAAVPASVEASSSLDVSASVETSSSRKAFARGEAARPPRPLAALAPAHAPSRSDGGKDAGRALVVVDSTAT